MPYYATNTLTPEDKKRILSVLPTSSTHLFAMARGQIYHTPFNATMSSEWKPLGLRGAIIFGRDSREQQQEEWANVHVHPTGGRCTVESVSQEEDDLWFRLVEFEGKKGSRVVWRQPVSAVSSDYKMLVPFFHVFSGNSRMFGFRFDDDEEASRFYETVMIRTNERPLVKPNPLSRTRSKNVQRRASALPAFPASKITKPEPGSFKHLAHVGVDDRGRILAEGEVDKEWSVLFNGSLGKNNFKNQRSPSFIGTKRLRDYLRD